MEFTMHQSSTDLRLTAPRPQATKSSSGSGHIVAGALFLVAWLSFFVFVVLYRAPLPDDAFAALSLELVAFAGPASTR
jgi:hypothetical protein